VPIRSPDQNKGIPNAEYLVVEILSAAQPPSGVSRRELIPCAGTEAAESKYGGDPRSVGSTSNTIAIQTSEITGNGHER